MSLSFQHHKVSIIRLTNRGARLCPVTAIDIHEAIRALHYHWHVYVPTYNAIIPILSYRIAHRILKGLDNLCCCLGF